MYVSSIIWEKGPYTINSFPANGNFCCLLITFANSVDPDQAWQNVRSDLDPNCLTFWWYSRKIFFEKVNFLKNPQTTEKHAKLPSMQRINELWRPGLAPDKALFSSEKFWYFSYFSMKIHVMVTLWKCTAKVLLMSTHKICFTGEIQTCLKGHLY